MRVLFDTMRPSSPSARSRSARYSRSCPAGIRPAEVPVAQDAHMVRRRAFFQLRRAEPRVPARAPVHEFHVIGGCSYGSRDGIHHVQPFPAVRGQLVARRRRRRARHHFAGGGRRARAAGYRPDAHECARARYAARLDIRRERILLAAFQRDGLLVHGFAARRGLVQVHRGHVQAQRRRVRPRAVTARARQLRPARAQIRVRQQVHHRLLQPRAVRRRVLNRAVVLREPRVPQLVPHAHHVPAVVELVRQLLARVRAGVFHRRHFRAHVLVIDLQLRAPLRNGRRVVRIRRVHLLQRQHPAHLLRGPALEHRAVVQRNRLILDVHPRAVVVIRTRKLQAGEVVGILRVRRRAAQFAVADARQAAKRRGVGEIHRAHRAALCRRRRDAGEQVVRIVEVRLAARRVCDLGNLPFRGVVAHLRCVLHAVPHRREPGLFTPRHDVEPHLRVPLVRNHVIRRIRLQLQAHALGVLIRRAAAFGEIVLRSIPVHPDVIVRAGDGALIYILVHAGLPAIAAIEIVACRQARVVIVVHRYRQAVARHRGIHVFEHHVAVVQVGIHRARAARAHGFVLPPAFQPRVGNEVHVHRGRVARAGVRGIQLRIVVPAHVVRLAEDHAVVAARATIKS